MATETTAAEPNGKGKRFLHWLSAFWATAKRSIPLAGSVSRHHYYEVRERYYQLKRLVDLQLKAIEGKDAPAERPVLEVCRDIVGRHEHRLTQRYDDLIRLSRALTFVRVLLIEKVFSDNDLYAQQGVLREELTRLKMEDSGRVGEILSRLAELSDEDGEVGKKRVPFRTLLRAGFERVNSIRVERIRDQWMHIRTYISALCLVVPTSVLMLMYEGTITRGWPDSADADRASRGSQTEPSESNSQSQGREDGAQPAEPESDSSSEEGAGSAQSGESPDGSPSGGGQAAPPPEEVKGDLQLENDKNYTQPEKGVLWVVFFGGFVGGLFSIVTRARDRKTVPGEDAYYAVYMITKPLIGAFGAALFFVLIGGGFASIEMLNTLPLEAGVKTFSFSIVAGFSERLVFPSFSGSASQ